MKPQTALLEELHRNLQTVGQLVEFLMDEKGKGDAAVGQILFANHPLFAALKEATRNSYRLYFATLSEMDEWLKAARGLERIPEDMQADPVVYEWVRTYKAQGGKEEVHYLYINKEVFTGAGDVKPMTPATWNEKFVRYERILTTPKPRPSPKSKAGFDDMDDDIPF